MTQTTKESVAARSELLDVLSDVKMKVQDKLGIVDFPIPQFVIIGKQSVGKSRLVEAFAGEQFNFVSGTLGSRRPTVLEFRNVQHGTSVWQVLNKVNNKWEIHKIDRVMELLADAHESLGKTVSKEPICVRIQSPHAVDMQIVDLPGFREFSLDKTKEDLAKEIETLNVSFMKDPRNVMICVEEAGDAANMATLGRCKQIDPSFERTVLVRNKLDKYYNDLNHENINAWLDGFGDLPPTLLKFTLTLPHWTDKDASGNLVPPPRPFVLLRGEMSDADSKELKSKGASEKYLSMIGFKNLSNFMERKIEIMFVEAINPILRKLREVKETQQAEVALRQNEMKDTNADSLINTIRDCGMSFAHALQYVMEGYVNSKVNRMTLEEELRQFWEWAEEEQHEYPLLPTEHFNSLDDYVGYMRDDAKVPAVDVAVNGGAMYRRIMIEVEIFLRFAEIASVATKEDVIQARGVSLGQLTWRDVIVKILTNAAHLPMRRRILYVANRIKWFFELQKDVILDFMAHVKGSPDEHLYSALYSKHVQLMRSNELIKKLVFHAYDQVIERQMAVYLELFHSTMSSTFSNPWVFLKKASASIEVVDFEQVRCMCVRVCVRVCVPTRVYYCLGF
eukprot:GHVR01132274.1.p1 GENE.GHVR01132274.1~~GHVR01132274.1.p1  ORF type:complete len:620 (+),score=123.12 GHVR01132274.1:134-1993(+)